MSTCCNHMFHTFQMYVTYVSSGCCKSRSDVAYIAMTIHVRCKCIFKCFSCFKRMLQAFYLYVAYVALAIHICCKGMFQLFQTYVESVLSRCCICYSVHTHMLQTYVINVSFVPDLCCNKCFMLQVFHEQTQQWDVGEGDSLGRSGLHVRAGSEASVTAGMEHKVVSMVVATGMEHEAASMGGQQARSTRQSRAQSCIHGQAGGTKHETKRSTKLHT
jgi:hypothetical protein